MRTLIFFGLLSASGGLGLGVSAEEPAAAVERMLKELDDDSPKVRDAATEAMILLWEDPAARKSVDDGVERGMKGGSAEVQARCKWIDETIGFCRSFGESVLGAVGISSLHKLYGADDPTTLTLFEKWTLSEETREAYGFKEEKQQDFLGRYVASRLETTPGKLRLIAFVQEHAGTGCAGGIAALIEDADAEVRERAILAVGAEMKEKPYLKLIAGHLKDTESGPRSAAALALCKLKARDYIPQIRRMMRTDPVPQVQERALQGLTELAPHECAEDVEALLKHEDWSVRAEAVKLLGRAAPQVYADRIVEMLKDKDHWPRIYAANALRQLPDPRYAKAVDDMLATMPDLMQKGAENERLGALLTIVSLDQKRKYDATIVGGLKNEVASVREQAVEEIQKWGDRKYAADLAPLLKDASGDVRGMVAFTLGRLNARESAPDIVPLLKDGNAWARGFAARALAMLDAKASAPDIARLLKDPDPQARGSAAVALGKLGAKEFAKEIAALRADSEICRLFDEEWKISGDTPVGSIATRVLERLGIDPEKK